MAVGLETLRFGPSFGEEDSPVQEAGTAQTTAARNIGPVSVIRRKLSYAPVRGTGQGRRQYSLIQIQLFKQGEEKAPRQIERGCESGQKQAR